jgi:hypothetical protein
MKNLIIAISLMSANSILALNTDTTKYLVKNFKFTDFSYKIGYVNIRPEKYYVQNGYNLAVGLVFKDQFAFDFGSDLGFFNSDRSNTDILIINQTSAGVYIESSYLICPKRIVNFSAGLRYGGAFYNSTYRYRDTLTNTYSIPQPGINDRYWHVSPVLGVYFNVFKYMSLSLNTSYRYEISKTSVNRNRNTFVIGAGLRIKLNYQEMLKKQQARMKLLMGAPQN